MASVPPDSPGTSESGNPALGAPNVKGAKLLYLVSWRNSGVPDARYVFADVPIFEATFPNTQALFLFDPATSHTTDILDALQASYINMDPSGKQPHIRDEWYYRPNGVTLHIQWMSFDLDDLLVPERWRGKLKECKRVLQGRGFSSKEGLRHNCKSKKSKKDQGHVSNSYCTRRLLLV